MADAKFIMDVSDLVKARQEIRAWGKENRDQIDAVNSRMTRLGRSAPINLKKMAAGTQLAGKSINNLGMKVQQAGYQIGDFAVQVQGGTNIMVALGQQGAQLAGIFGPAGAIAGAALAITTGLLAPLFRGEKAAKELTNRIKELREELLQMKGFQPISKEQETSQNAIAKVDEEIVRLKERELVIDKAILANAHAKGDTVDDWTRKEKDRERLGTRMADNEERLNAQLEARSKLQRTSNQLVRGHMSIERLKSVMQMEELEREKKILEITKKHGTESLEARRLLRDVELERYQIEITREGTLKSMIPSLVEAKKQTLEMKDAMEASALAGTKITYRLGGDSATRFRKYGSRATTSSKAIDDGLPKSTKTTKDAYAELIKDLELGKELLKLDQDRATVIQALGEDRNNYSKSQIEKAVQMTRELRLQNEALDDQKSLQSTITDGFEDAFMAMVDGTKSFKDAFKGMANEVIKELYRIFVVKQITGMVQKAAGNLLGIPEDSYAGGGYTGSGARTGGVDGMGGFPAILHPNETVIDHNVAGSGGGGGAVVVNQTFNFSANGDESVKKIIAMEAPKIASMTQQQIMDARRRGGSMKATFG